MAGVATAPPLGVGGCPASDVLAMVALGLCTAAAVAFNQRNLWAAGDALLGDLSG